MPLRNPFKFFALVVVTKSRFRISTVSTVGCLSVMNSVIHKSPKYKRLGHLPMETADIRNLNYISATRPKNCNGLRRSTDRDDRLDIRMVLKL